MKTTSNISGEANLSFGIRVAELISACHFLDHCLIGEETGVRFFRFEFDRVMASSMAAVGVLRLPTTASASSSSSGGSNRARRSNLRSLSFAASHLSGDKIDFGASGLGSRRVSGGRAAPLIVFPKAVSDSKNSQTCLDPDASRVGILVSLWYSMNVVIDRNWIVSLPVVFDAFAEFTSFDFLF